MPHAASWNPCSNERPRYWWWPTAHRNKAVALARRFCELGRVEGCGLDGPDGQSFDVIINATAASLSDTVPALPASVVDGETWCYDMMYADEPTAFVRWGTEHGARSTLGGRAGHAGRAGRGIILPVAGDAPGYRPGDRSIA